MNTLTEGELQLSLPVGARGRCFDDPATHGLTHCMKAVDFIVETADRIWFIEFKDPEHSRAGERSREVFCMTFAAAVWITTSRPNIVIRGSMSMRREGLQNQFILPC